MILLFLMPLGSFFTPLVWLGIYFGRHLRSIFTSYVYNKAVGNDYRATFLSLISLEISLGVVFLNPFFGEWWSLDYQKIIYFLELSFIIISLVQIFLFFYQKKCKIINRD